MSVRSLTTLAVARDAAAPSAAVDGGSAGAAGGTKKQTFTDALTSAIPTEPLAAYTGFVSIIAALKHSGSYPYLPLRWWAYGAFLLVVIVSVQISYKTKTGKPEPGIAKVTNRPIPVPEMLSATIAAAAWGMIMPGSALQTHLTGDTATVVTACITFGGAALLALITPTLIKGSKTQPAVATAAAQQTPPDPADPAPPADQAAPGPVAAVSPSPAIQSIPE